jgi:hypothetical protein
MNFPFRSELGEENLYKLEVMKSALYYVRNILQIWRIVIGCFMFVVTTL